VRILTVLLLDGATARDGDAARHDVCAEGPEGILLAPAKAAKPSSGPGRLHEGATGAGQMIQLKGREIAKVLLDELGRTPMYGLDPRREVRTSRMGQCEDCERLWKAYQTATIESVQLYEELKSITEDQGLEKLSGTTARAEAAERLREEARQRLAEHQAATGHR